MKAVQLAAACIFVAAAGTVPMIVHGQTASPGVGTKGTWTQKTPMMTARSEVSLAEVGGKIYVMGGGINGTSVPHNEEYDIATDKWRVRHPLPRGLDHMGVAVVNGKIITVGPPLPTARSGLAYAHSKDKIRQTGADNRPRKGRHLSSMAQL